MRFLLDVHISFKVKTHLLSKGYDCIHTNELPNSYNSSDNELRDYAITNKFILITKDSELNSQIDKAISHIEIQNINIP